MRTDSNHDAVPEMIPAYINKTLDVAAWNQVEQHLGRCDACQRELEVWQAVGSATSGRAAGLWVPSVSVMDRVISEINHGEREKAMVRTNTDGGPAAESLQRRPDEVLLTLPRGRRVPKLLWGAAAAVLLAVLVATTPIGSAAQSFITIFQPKQLVAVPVASSDLDSLPNLTDFGTVTGPTGSAQPQQFSSAIAAEGAIGTHVLVPGNLPSGIPTTATYSVMPAETASFTFSKAKAAASAAAKGTSAPPMPAAIDGSSLQVSTSPVVITSYGRPSAPGASENASRSGTTGGSSNAGSGLGTMLVIAQSNLPEVKSTGVSVTELENYLLQQPGVSPQLAQEIKSIGDPSSTLPIPIPVERAASHSVQVQGVQGLAVADSTGLGGGIIWQKNGAVYGVAGTLTESQLLAVANSLH